MGGFFSMYTEFGYFSISKSDIIFFTFNDKKKENDCRFYFFKLLYDKISPVNTPLSVRVRNNHPHI